ncbi:MAG TPA: DUF4199 family protein [Pedobacter sp.]|jgi:hypothetical protein
MADGLKEIRKDAFLNGLILGLILMLIDIAELHAFAYSHSTIFIMSVYILNSILMPLAAVIILITKLRTKIGGYWTLRQATSGIFITFITAYLSSSFGLLLSFEIIPSSINLAAKTNFIDAIRTLLENIKAPQQKINDTVKSIGERFDATDAINVSSIFTNLIFLVIILFVAAFLFAGIFKRESTNSVT